MSSENNNNTEELATDSTNDPAGVMGDGFSDAGKGANGNDDLLLTRFFNWVGDLFSKMVRGIFVFAFKTLPLALWRLIFNQRLFRLVKSAARMIFWIVTWIVVVFASWLVVDIEKFKWFWRTVWNFCWVYISQLVELAKVYANEIWIVIALLGSVYGLLYIPAKFVWRFWKRRRAEKRAKTGEGEP